MEDEEGRYKKVVGEGGQDQHRAVDGDRQGNGRVIACPSGDEGNERKPEDEVDVGPKNHSIDALYGLEEVVMVVPVDRQVEEAECVGQELRSERRQGRGRGAGWGPELQHHNRHDDGDYGVAEGFEPALGQVDLLRRGEAAQRLRDSRPWRPAPLPVRRRA